MHSSPARVRDVAPETQIGMQSAVTSGHRATLQCALSDVFQSRRCLGTEMAYKVQLPWCEEAATTGRPDVLQASGSCFEAEIPPAMMSWCQHSRVILGVTKQHYSTTIDGSAE